MKRILLAVGVGAVLGLLCHGAAPARSKSPVRVALTNRVLNVPLPDGTMAVIELNLVPKHKPTNFPVLTFSWTAPNWASNTVSSYELSGGNSDDTLRWFWSFPASNNSLTVGFNSKSPCWFQVSLVDQYGNVSPATPRFYTNVPAWPSICSYRAQGTNYVGWWAFTNHGWKVLAVGSTNPIFTLTPSSNMLVRFALPTNKSGVGYRVLEQ